MAKKITDDEDNLKRRARRRLIGAVALTTAVVVILPMVLDSEPKPVGTDIELRIPDKDKVGDFTPDMQMPSAPAATASTPMQQETSAPVVDSPIAASSAVATLRMIVAAKRPVSETAPAKVEAKPEAKPEIKAEIKAETKPESKPKMVADTKTEAKPVVQPTVKAESKPEAKTPVKLESKPEAKTESKSETKPEIRLEAKPVAKAESKPADKDKVAAHSGFVVQVGAFSKADTVRQWQKKLSKQGIKSYTEKAGANVRVRIGPYSTREAAEKVRRKIEAQGAHPVIVNLAQ